MIGLLRGRILHKQPPQLLLDVQGVGYEIDAPMTTFYNLPNVGEDVTLYTHLAVREDAHTLYGFLKTTDRDLFRHLLKVNGVGARLALTILSGMEPAQFVQYLQHGDTDALVRLPGIGKKTAERLLLELKGKLGAELDAHGRQGAADAGADVSRALLALGYSEREVAAATRELAKGTGVSDGIRQALKQLAKP